MKTKNQKLFAVLASLVLFASFMIPISHSAPPDDVQLYEMEQSVQSLTVESSNWNDWMTFDDAYLSVGRKGIEANCLLRNNMNGIMQDPRINISFWDASGALIGRQSEVPKGCKRMLPGTVTDFTIPLDLVPADAVRVTISISGATAK